MNASRIHPMNMSDQSLLELLVSSINSKDIFLDMHGEFLDIHEWKGLNFHKNGEVRRIEWSHGNGKAYFESGGSISFKWLPQKVEHVNLSNNKFHGTLRFKELPISLTYIAVCGNKLRSDLDLQNIPEDLSIVAIDDNCISGSIDLTRMPDALEYLNASKNTLNGEISLANLPDDLEELHLSENALHGSLSFRNLPDIRVLDLHGNNFSGELDLSCLPESIEEINLRENGFLGTARIHTGNLPNLALLFVHDNDLNSVMDQNGCVFVQNGKWQGFPEEEPDDLESLQMALGFDV